jgi:hypothetical protein
LKYILWLLIADFSHAFCIGRTVLFAIALGMVPSIALLVSDDRVNPVILRTLSGIDDTSQSGSCFSAAILTAPGNGVAGSACYGQASPR